jgi:hypothetical protein
MMSGFQALSTEALKFSVDSYIKIKKFEESARKGKLSLNASSSITCKFPPNSLRTPDMEFGRNRFNKNLWAFYSHGNCVASFDEKLMVNLKTVKFPD